MYKVLKFGTTSLFPYVIRLLSQIIDKNLEITSNHCEFMSFLTLVHTAQLNLIIYLLFISVIIIIIITTIAVINIYLFICGCKVVAPS